MHTQIVAIVKDPESIIVAGGENATLTVATIGDSLIYQWRKDGVDITDTPGAYLGASTPTLVVLSTDDDDEGLYQVTVTSMGKQDGIISTSASLTVRKCFLMCLYA